jgi:uncharacterized protein YPO0396
MMSSQEVMLEFEPTYRLTKFELYNWGGFSGAQDVEFDPMGTAIVGPTGSGKTTLIDALMTLLTANPKYNLASTGGHESDRDLISYVRGVSGAGNGSLSQEHVLRSGKVVTGLCATLSNGIKQIKIGAVLSIDDTSFATKDLKKYWIFADGIADDEAPMSLRQWLEIYDDGGSRSLQREAKITSGLTVYTAKKSYLARVRDYFEVRQNAFELLNRAAGLKQLNSIDEIFRTLVLDDESQFDQAAQVANSFDDLTAIYEELELARRQVASLEPVKKYWQHYESFNTNREAMGHLLAILPVWFAESMYQRWKSEAKRLQDQSSANAAQIAELEDQYKIKSSERDDLNAIYLRSGGDDIRTIEENIALWEKALYARLASASNYQMRADALGLNSALTRVAFDGNQSRLSDIIGELTTTFDQAEQAHFSAGAELRGVQDQHNELTEELRAAENTPGSNIPSAFLKYRSLLADSLGLQDTDFPFIAEMVQVKPEELEWHGAIERAIGGHRLRIMVPESEIRAALRWVNQRNNHLHVRLYEVKNTVKSATFFENGYTRKLEYKAHPYREAVKALLAGFDLHCVESADELQLTPHALTKEGLMSGKARFFEKQDQKRLADDWMTGFDNRSRLKQLSNRLVDVESTLKELQISNAHKRNQVEECRKQMAFASSLASTEFDSINTQDAESNLHIQKERLSRLTAPDSDVALAKSKYDQAKQNCAEIEQQKKVAIEQNATTIAELKHAETETSRAYQYAEKGLKDNERQIADTYLNGELKEYVHLLNTVDLREMKPVEESALKDVRARWEKLGKQAEELSRHLVRSMAGAQREDRGALSEVGTDIEDITAYLERLSVLIEEALPEKQKRFREYLNRSSDDGVTALLETLDGAVAKIREKLDDVNYTLRRVDFQPGRYLQLVANYVVHESIRTFSRHMTALRAAQLAADDGQDHYKALQVVIATLRNHYEKSHTAPAKALLDPRFRLEFKVSVIDRLTGDVLETRSGSQGGSGGEKEIIASYVLTASLSYALCPDGSNKPIFGTIVLDEAFSRSSHAVAGRIISALTEFGLNALFVTPNKEMRLLRSHTRSAIVVHRKGNQSSLTTLSWRELEDAAGARRVEKADNS